MLCRTRYAPSYAIEPVKTNRMAYGYFSACTGALISGRRRNRRVHYAAARVTGRIPCRPAPIVSDLANRDRSYVARRCDRCGRCDGHRLRRCCRSCCTHHNRARHESGRRRPAVPVRVGTVVTVVVVVLHVGNCRSTRVLHFLCAGLTVTLVLSRRGLTLGLILGRGRLALGLVLSRALLAVGLILTGVRLRRTPGTLACALICA